MAIKYASENTISRVISDTKTLVSGKVDKVQGKGLSTNDYTDAEKTKLASLDVNGEANVIETVKVNGSALTPDANKAVDVTVPTNTNQLTNGAGFITNTANDLTNYYTKTQIDATISSVYKPAGSVAFASLPTLSASVLGNVYNVTDAFTTTSDFVEGAGKSYPAGTNVVVVDAGSNTYKFDVLSGFVDLSNYATTSDVNAKYTKPSGGIPKTDLASGVQTSLGKADTALQSITSSDVTTALGFTPTNVTSSSTNGNIKINNTETTVYTLPNTVLEDSDLVEITTSEVDTWFNS